MSSKSQQVSVGITKSFPCSYLDNQLEQLLVLQEESVDLALFEQLLALGFRRSGGTIYKPQCPHCSACLPIRIPTDEFTPSRRQKRTLRNNRDLIWKIVDKQAEYHYALYEIYINQRHNDGPMYPASREQYQHFIGSAWLDPIFIELWSDKKLVGVAVTDILPNSLSAIYTFFAPDEHKRSLGSLSILIQCRLAKLMGKGFVYLGYQIDESRKMNYKRDYTPYQILTGNGWLQMPDDT
ncbi:arginyltransferase [Shewanella eurypsychrophilus]|uniref:Aspartate/glutamate leucyltransferase n=1 Tax=Shewanella eurypsychrophilus TaxID=2593656 RepID=A0ABX6V6Z8_9GAMM|nr:MULTISPECIES: arginyltransferase [Shewanella]QFU23121.1 arginyltransferase [Shewanella sp. YLB-09]QPG58404.1 arginyltransferase [Shewanella eurypsychrophilus]